MGDITGQTFDFTTASASSSAVSKEHLHIVALFDATGGAYEIHGCDTEDGTFAQCQDKDGTDLTITTTAGQPIEFPWSEVRGVPFLKLVLAAAPGADYSVTPKFKKV